MSTDDIVDAINNAFISRYDSYPTTSIKELIERVNKLAEDRDYWTIKAIKAEAEIIKLKTKLMRL